METNGGHGICEPAAALGVRIAIDDFGTGYSSLEYLLVYCVSRIKIAQQFVSGLPGDPAARPSCVQRLAWRVNSASRLSPKVSRQPHNWNFSLAPDPVHPRFLF